MTLADQLSLFMDFISPLSFHVTCVMLFGESVLVLVTPLDGRFKRGTRTH